MCNYVIPGSPTTIFYRLVSEPTFFIVRFIIFQKEPQFFKWWLTSRVILICALLSLMLRWSRDDTNKCYKPSFSSTRLLCWCMLILWISSPPLQAGFCEDIGYQAIRTSVTRQPSEFMATSATTKARKILTPSTFVVKGKMGVIHSPQIPAILLWPLIYVLAINQSSTIKDSVSPPQVRCGLAAQALGITMNAHSESASQVAPGGWKQLIFVGSGRGKHLSHEKRPWLLRVKKGDEILHS